MYFNFVEIIFEFEFEFEFALALEVEVEVEVEVVNVARCFQPVSTLGTLHTRDTRAESTVLRKHEKK